MFFTVKNLGPWGRAEVYPHYYYISTLRCTRDSVKIQYLKYCGRTDLLDSACNWCEFVAVLICLIQYATDASLWLYWFAWFSMQLMGVCGWLAYALHCKSRGQGSTPGHNGVKDHSSVLLSQHMCRPFSACLAFTCTAYTKIFNNNSNSHIYI